MRRVKPRAKKTSSQESAQRQRDKVRQKRQEHVQRLQEARDDALRRQQVAGREVDAIQAKIDELIPATFDGLPNQTELERELAGVPRNASGMSRSRRPRTRRQAIRERVNTRPRVREPIKRRGRRSVYKDQKKTYRPKHREPTPKKDIQSLPARAEAYDIPAPKPTVEPTQKSQEEKITPKTQRRERLKQKRLQQQRTLRERKTIRHPVKASGLCTRELKIPPFVGYDDYEYTLARPIVTLHVIESLGLGGSQVMMAELVNGLKTYFSQNGKHIFAALQKQGYDRKMYASYNVRPEIVPQESLAKYCKRNNVDIVVHHRVSLSNDVSSYLPKNVAYVLINHTVHSMYKLKSFNSCDVYVSVCEYLDRQGRWPGHAHATRRLAILNGIENNHLDDIEAYNVSGKFVTGRCHRLVPGKFRLDSLGWLQNTAAKHVKGLTHYLLGNSSKARVKARGLDCIRYMGQITQRERKMSIIKALDMYFYDTTQNEGASIAILEALACGVPVLCKKLGGCPELVKTGVNGYVEKDRDGFLKRMKSLSDDKKALQKLKASTLEDFNNRLHVKHTACKYMQLFEAVLRDRKAVDI